MAKLGDVGVIITGNTPKTSDNKNYDSNDICFIKPSDIDDELTDLYNSEYYISEYARSKARIVPVSSILVTCIGIVGKVGINAMECAFNQQINAIIPDTKKCDCRYLAYAIQYEKPRLQNIANAPVVPILNKSQFSDIEISFPPLDEQRKISAVLDKVSDLIAKRRQQLEKLDLLVKARFTEMFGDPVSNPRNWEKVALSDLADVSIGPFGSLLHKEDYIMGGHPLVNPSHIIDGKICPDDKLTISDKKYNELTPYHLKVNDVVMGRRGEMGRCAVVYASGLLCGTGSLIIRTKGFVTADYLQKILSFPSFKKMIEDMAVGQTMPNLNVSIVSNFQIIKPPLKIQNEYYNFIEKIEMTKISIKESLEKLETLKKSLMQEYFG